MSVLEMYNEFRSEFPNIATKADEIHIKFWGSLDPEYTYSWFESLAKALNREMHNREEATTYTAVCEYFRKAYLFGDDEAKNCIDVSFTENLFWRVEPEKAKGYWSIFPDLLKDLYVNFHNRPPA